MTRTLAAILVLACAAPAARACDDARGADGRFAEPALAAAEALASQACDEPLDRRLASARYWRPERGVFMREEIWAFGPEGARGTCFIDAAANEAGEPDQIVLRCQALYRCPEGAETRREPVTCAPAE